MRLLARMLSHVVQVGSLRVYDADGRLHEFRGRPGPVAAIRLWDCALYRSILLGPELALGEAYMDGLLTLEEGTTLRDFLKAYPVNSGDFHM